MYRLAAMEEEAPAAISIPAAAPVIEKPQVRNPQAASILKYDYIM